MLVLTDMKMTATCLLLPDVFGDDPSLFVVVNEKVCSMLMSFILYLHITYKVSDLFKLFLSYSQLGYIVTSSFTVILCEFQARFIIVLIYVSMGSDAIPLS